MGKGNRLNIRVARSLINNTVALMRELCELDLRDNQNMTAYTIEAIKEKRVRDLARIEEHARKSEAA